MISINKFLFATLLIICISGLQTALAVVFKECDSGKTIGNIKSLELSDCTSDSGRCKFLRGTNKTIELKFVPNEKVNSVKIKVSGKIKAADMPFIIKPDDACGNYGLECPLDANKEQTFKLSMPILRAYPPIDVDVILRLLDDNRKPIVCADIPAKID